MTKTLRMKRSFAVIALIFSLGAWAMASPGLWSIQEDTHLAPTGDIRGTDRGEVSQALEALQVKGRAPKNNYARAQFGSGWVRQEGCDMRNIILLRDLESTVTDKACHVLSGTLHDPYTGELVIFKRGPEGSRAVQIDHVVALSNAWQTGAQQLGEVRRIEFANDPLNLLAVDGNINQAKGDGDAATWLPPQRSFRCQYVARQVAVKYRYNLWVTAPEKDAIQRVLQQCPHQPLPEK